ncbi:hypothetical protein A3Q56_03474 [Intoshia linei]|uniref:Uncharacterized protein n=1 Tax=Intoshia linei TaxID=1819745 RepID=A0A177B3B9_9BILA|nr:hypothetical protein A3Q56_03474 [Intoshia linei]
MPTTRDNLFQIQKKIKKKYQIQNKHEILQINPTRTKNHYVDFTCDNLNYNQNLHTNADLSLSRDAADIKIDSTHLKNENIYKSTRTNLLNHQTQFLEKFKFEYVYLTPGVNLNDILKKRKKRLKFKYLDSVIKTKTKNVSKSKTNVYFSNVVDTTRESSLKCNPCNFETTESIKIHPTSRKPYKTIYEYIQNFLVHIFHFISRFRYKDTKSSIN